MYDRIQNAALLFAVALIVSGVWLRFGLPSALISAGALLVVLIFIARIVR